MTFLKLLRVFGSRPEHIPVLILLPFLSSLLLTSKQKLDHTTNTAVHYTRGFCIVHEQTQCPPHEWLRDESWLWQQRYSGGSRHAQWRQWWSGWVQMLHTFILPDCQLHECRNFVYLFCLVWASLTMCVLLHMPFVYCLYSQIWPK